MSSSNSKAIGIATQNVHLGSSTGESYSKFRGVLRLKSGKWGARISHNYKSYWLGTYGTEAEAAMAYDRAAMTYDRAAIKLQRSDSPLSFHMSAYGVQETKFQSQYSNEQILERCASDRITERGIDIRGNVSGVDGNIEDETDSGIKLFGVLIGKRK